MQEDIGLLRAWAQSRARLATADGEARVPLVALEAPR
jgi:hypothetical protein